MSLTIQRVGSAVHVLHGADTLPESEEVELFTAHELTNLQREQRDWLDLQRPAFIRGDEDEDGEALFILALSSCSCPPLL